MNPLTLLAIDDDRSIHSVFKDAVSCTRYAKHIHFISAFDGELGLKCLNYQTIDVSFVDFKLPKISGLDILKEQAQKTSVTDFIMISGQQSIETAVEAFRLGAKDFILKPFDYPNLKSHIEKLFEDHQVDPKSSGGKDTALKSLIGESPSMIKLHRQIKKVAQSDLSVLILGESGTGKELIAQAIHDSSKRANKPFIAINCGAIPRELIESELFGHEKGAFTGAVSKKIGCFQQADGGTLFLDEIGDLDFDLQVKLLRVLQENEIRPVGTHKKVKVDLRIISATHRDLESYMAKQLFREDLYFRLNVFPIHAPALRDKVEDISLLANHFLEGIQQRYGGKKKILSDRAIQQLCNYGWKGNVRELRNCMERLYISFDDSTFIDHIPEDLFQFKDFKGSVQSPIGLNGQNLISSSQVSTLAEVERMAIKSVLAHFNYNILKTAQALSIGRDTLYRKMKLYDLKNPSKSPY